MFCLFRILSNNVINEHVLTYRCIRSWRKVFPWYVLCFWRGSISGLRIRAVRLLATPSTAVASQHPESHGRLLAMHPSPSSFSDSVLLLCSLHVYMVFALWPEMLCCLPCSHSFTCQLMCERVTSSSTIIRFALDLYLFDYNLGTFIFLQNLMN